jgi:hypothetical protein
MYTTTRSNAGGTLTTCSESGHAISMNKICAKPLPKNGTTMSPQKRERYAQWLRNTGVEHPSDELINKTRERALRQIDAAKEKAQRYNLKLVKLILFSLAIGVYLWFKL